MQWTYREILEDGRVRAFAEEILLCVECLDDEVEAHLFGSICAPLRIELEHVIKCLALPLGVGSEQEVIISLDFFQSWLMEVQVHDIAVSMVEGL